MGSLFPAVVFYLVTFCSNTLHSRILLPQKPKEIPVPQKSKERFQKERERLRKNTKKPEQILPALDSKLSKSTQPKNNFRYGISFGLKSVKIDTTGSERDSFWIEYGQSIGFMYRLGENFPKISSSDYVLGFRANIFSGKGRHQERLGRFGYIYGGPLFGIILNLRKREKLVQKYHAIPAVERVFGYLLGERWALTALIGVSQRAGFADYEGSDEDKGIDVQTLPKPLADGSGLWLELGAARQLVPGLTLGLKVGALAASKKSFRWTSIVLTGWT